MYYNIKSQTDKAVSQKEKKIHWNLNTNTYFLTTGKEGRKEGGRKGEERERRKGEKEKLSHHVSLQMGGNMSCIKV